ncbi:MAG: hypothetical protein AB7P00_43100, partial [Sandaracinaceae bacterium]
MSGAMDDLSHDAVREALLDVDDAGELSEAMQSHLSSCAECQGFATALLSVDAGLASLAPIAPPDAMLERARQAVERAPSEPEAAPAGIGGFFVAIVASIASGLWALGGLLFGPLFARRAKATNEPASAPRAEKRNVLRGLAIVVPAVAAVGLLFVGGVGFLAVGGDAMPSAQTPNTSWLGEPEEDELPMPSGGEATEHGMDEQQRLPLRTPSYAEANAALDGPAQDVAAASAPSRPTNEVIDPWDDGHRGGRVDLPPGSYRVQLAQRGYEGDLAEGEASRDSLVVDGRWQNQTPAGEPASTPAVPRPSVNGAPASGATALRPADIAGQPRAQTLDTRPAGHATPVETPARDRALEAQNLEQESELGGDRSVVDEDDDGIIDTASFIPRVDPVAERDALAGLTFRAAEGYWQNTYVPGDPVIRALHRQLLDDPAARSLAELAQPAAPGFEAPRAGALALDVTADRREVEGRSRVLVSVGLRGAAQRAGRRPQLRAQVLLDLRRPLDDEAQARVRALLSALSRRRDGPDRVGFLVAGPDGGERLPLGMLRYGELTVALRRTFEAGADDAHPLALRDALEQAIGSVGQLEGDAPLGSAMVLLVTPSLTDEDARSLETTAHVGALAGVTTTVIALDDASSQAVERVALAGQGRRRALRDANEADGVVRSEIEAVSRVVARAVRLRIRLAEGVQLVDVLGSHRLDDVEAQRVRRAEQAIDAALARRLGITSDRGEDEDGIQIVVPAFYADDAHRILLDVVVPGPGPVADVQVRFKDLLRLGNATLTDRVELARGAAGRGPSERRVLSAWLGHETASA